MEGKGRRRGVASIWLVPFRPAFRQGKKGKHKGNKKAEGKGWRR